MQIKTVSFPHALLVFIGVFIVIAAGMFYLNQLLHVALFVALLWVGLHARIMGFRYISQREFMNSAIARSLPAIYIFLLIGLLIAALMKSGTVAMLIYYGLDNAVIYIACWVYFMCNDVCCYRYVLGYCGNNRCGIDGHG